MAPRGSGGSAENLRSLNKNAVDLGIVYSGDAFLGRNAKLPGDPVHYDRVRALSFLYGAPAQLVVRKDSDILSVRDLAGKTVAVGNPGSGAALSAERFFRHLSLWDKMKIRNLGYSQAASDFADKRIDAFWVLVGYPNSAIIEAATRTPIRLLDLHREASESGFYDIYPFYVRVEIPAHTYEGQDASVTTFQDASLWCASDVLGRERGLRLPQGDLFARGAGGHGRSPQGGPEHDRVPGHKRRVHPPASGSGPVLEGTGADHPGPPAALTLFFRLEPLCGTGRFFATT